WSAVLPRLDTYLVCGPVGHEPLRCTLPAQRPCPNMIPSDSAPVPAPCILRGPQSPGQGPFPCVPVPSPVPGSTSLPRVKVPAPCPVPLPCSLPPAPCSRLPAHSPCLF